MSRTHENTQAAAYCPVTLCPYHCISNTLHVFLPYSKQANRLLYAFSSLAYAGTILPACFTAGVSSRSEDSTQVSSHSFPFTHSFYTLASCTDLQMVTNRLHGNTCFPSSSSDGESWREGVCLTISLFLYLLLSLGLSLCLINSQ